MPAFMHRFSMPQVKDRKGIVVWLRGFIAEDQRQCTSCRYIMIQINSFPQKFCPTNPVSFAFDLQLPPSNPFALTNLPLTNSLLNKMKLSAFHALLVALALNRASAIALPEPEYYVVANTDKGPVYSSVAPHQRRDTNDISYYPVSTNEHGTVYSNVDPNAKKQKRDDGPYKPVPQEEVEKFINEQLSCIL